MSNQVYKNSSKKYINKSARFDLIASPASTGDDIIPFPDPGSVLNNLSDVFIWQSLGTYACPLGGRFRIEFDVATGATSTDDSQAFIQVDSASRYGTANVTKSSWTAAMSGVATVDVPPGGIVQLRLFGPTPVAIYGETLHPDSHCRMYVELLSILI